MTASFVSVGLSSGQPLPTLWLVEADAVHLHEDADPHRVAALAVRLQQEDVLRNPPIGAPLPGGGFVILDGANRATALRTMSVPFHLLQIVEYDTPEIRVDVWHHLLREDEAVLGALPQEQVVTLSGRVELEQRLGDGALACGLVTEAGVFGLQGGRDLAARIGTLRRVVASYAGHTPIYRVPTADLEGLRAEFDRVGIIVVFPHFSKGEILALADLPEKLPAGITRHVIPNRALRVNLPLDMLRGPGTLAEKNVALADLIHARLLAHRIRAYPEATVVFDD